MIGTLDLTLHRKETDSYRHNLASGEPSGRSKKRIFRRMMTFSSRTGRAPRGQIRRCVGVCF